MRVKAVLFYLSLVVITPLILIMGLIESTLRYIIASFNVVTHYLSIYEYKMFDVEKGSFVNDARYKTLAEVWDEGYSGNYVSTFDRYMEDRKKKEEQEKNEKAK